MLKSFPSAFFWGINPGGINPSLLHLFFLPGSADQSLLIEVRTDEFDEFWPLGICISEGLACSVKKPWFDLHRLNN